MPEMENLATHRHHARTHCTTYIIHPFIKEEALVIHQFIIQKEANFSETFGAAPLFKVTIIGSGQHLFIILLVRWPNT